MTDDPFWNLRNLPDPDDRKLRLFACAIARKVAHLAKAPGFLDVVALAERFADGQATAEDLAEVCRLERQRYDASDGDQVQKNVLYARYCLARPVALEAALETCSCAMGAEADHRRQALRASGADVRGRRGVLLSGAFDKGWNAMGEVAIALQRDIFGDPSNPAVDPAWLAWNGGAVRALAGQIYDEGDFALMPILADALEEAGCAEERILAHCRGKGEHVRGCWVLDLLSPDRIMPRKRPTEKR